MTAFHGFENLTLPDLHLKAGGERLQSGSTSPNIDPCSGETSEEIPIATSVDVDQIVEAAWQAFKAPSWRDLNPLARANAAGIEAMTVPSIIPDGGYYFPPTVLRDVPSGAEVSRDEVFGPVLAIAPFDDIEEAIALANDSAFGLAAHVFTKELNVAHRTAAALEAGTVFVNCILLADPAFPFGGMKMSGIGRENGSEVLDPYLEPKSVIMALA